MESQSAQPVANKVWERRWIIGLAALSLYSLAYVLPTYKSDKVELGYAAAIVAFMGGLFERWGSGDIRGFASLLYTLSNACMIGSIVILWCGKSRRWASLYATAFLICLSAPFIYDINVYIGFYVWVGSMLLMAWAMTFDRSAPKIQFSLSGLILASVVYGVALAITIPLNNAAELHGNALPLYIVFPLTGLLSFPFTYLIYTYW